MYSCLLQATRLHSYGVECANRPCSSSSKSPAEAVNIETDGSFKGEDSFEAI